MFVRLKIQVHNKRFLYSDVFYGHIMKRGHVDQDWKINSIEKIWEEAFSELQARIFESETKASKVTEESC